MAARPGRRPAVVLAFAALFGSLAWFAHAPAAQARTRPTELLLTAPGPTVAPGVRPRDFWLTSTQAVAIARRQRSVRAIAAAAGVQPRPWVAGLGLWAVDFDRGGAILTSVRIEDRTRYVLPRDQWAWTPVARRIVGYQVRLEIAMAILALGFAALLLDFRRPLRLRNLDLLVLLSLAVALAYLDRGRPLDAIPLLYPPLAYLFARLAWTGLLRGRAAGPQRGLPGVRALIAALIALEFVRLGFAFAWPATSDVSYASAFGANSIHHGLSLYGGGGLAHLDTYGPLNYLAYLPFELAFPMTPNWTHDYLPAAHAAGVVFELLTVAGLIVLGRRMRGGQTGRRLGLLLACGWAACPFTLIPLALNNNDALLVMLLVWALVALANPLWRGLLVGAAAAVKFAPLALAALFAAGRGEDRRRELPIAALAAGAAFILPIVAFLPHPGGVGKFWDDTLGYQLGRRSIMSLWGQHPALEPLRLLIATLTVALGGAALVIRRPRELHQVAALAGAIVIGIEMAMRFWSLFYLAWLVPFVLVGLIVRAPSAPAPVADPFPARPSAERATEFEALPA